MQTMVQSTHTPDITLPSVAQEHISSCLSAVHGVTIFRTGGHEFRQYAPPPQLPILAAILQKAAQMALQESSQIPTKITHEC